MLSIISTVNAHWKSELKKAENDLLKLEGKGENESAFLQENWQLNLMQLGLWIFALS